ncbi:MAG TPA: UDP-N-acetylglucosamine 2-epimerase (non-hydrolyzing) [Bacteroidota bacterium]|nr:UDP-N-acetylglucosamine 2-epimerase (non-hydrolyzing) [Bacteroidota bacterium]
MKVAVVFGTRPETIKMAPVVKELRRRKIGTSVIVTAQHRQMLDQMLAVFNLVPDHDLRVMQDNQDLFHVTSAVLERLKPVLAGEKPDVLLVQGDTTTTFAASLAAFYLKIPVGHVEAGLRTWDPMNPFPEEINRQLTTRITAHHFPPTAWAKKNLLAEGIREDAIHVTGNTVIDALLMIVDPKHRFTTAPLSTIDFDNKKIILLTSHRRENFGPPMAGVFEACRDIVREHADVELVYPVHPNPNVREAAHRILGKEPRVHLIAPLEYQTFIQVMNKSYLIMTDSGGVQEEAPTLGKPVLVLRSATERPEAIEAGTARLVGTDGALIRREAARLLRDRSAYDEMANRANPYGDGKAAERIVDVIRTRYR